MDVNIPKLDSSFPQRHDKNLLYLNLPSEDRPIVFDMLLDILGSRSAEITSGKDSYAVKDKLIYVVDALANITDKEQKISIDKMFRIFLSSIVVEPVILDKELDRLLAYAISPNKKDEAYVACILERILTALLSLVKDYNVSTIIAYIYISMFYDPSVKVLYSTNLSSHLKTLLTVTWYSYIHKITSSVDIIIRVMCREVDEMIKSDHTMNPITTYAYIAFVFATIGISQCVHSYEVKDMGELASYYLAAGRSAIDEYCDLT